MHRSLELYIDDILVGALANVDNDTRTIEETRMGLLALKGGASESARFDQAAWRRFTFIAPNMLGAHVP